MSGRFWAMPLQDRCAIGDHVEPSSGSRSCSEMFSTAAPRPSPGNPARPRVRPVLPALEDRAQPFYDAKAQYQRAQVSLIDQRFSALQSAQNIPNLTTVFRNELASIDANVYQLQIAYLNTILMSPIPRDSNGRLQESRQPRPSGRTRDTRRVLRRDPDRGDRDLPRAGLGKPDNR